MEIEKEVTEFVKTINRGPLKEYFPKEKTVRETERRKEAYASGRKCRDPAGSIYECFKTV